MEKVEENDNIGEDDQEWREDEYFQMYLVIFESQMQCVNYT